MDTTSPVQVDILLPLPATPSIAEASTHPSPSPIDDVETSRWQVPEEDGVLKEAIPLHLPQSTSGQSPSESHHYDSPPQSCVLSASKKSPPSLPAQEFSNTRMLEQFLVQRGLEHRRSNTELELADTNPTPATSQERPDTRSGTNEESEGTKSYADVPKLGFISQSITLPPIWNRPSEPHRYLASIALLQRRALVQSLSQDCSVHLAEMDELFGPDIIVDSHSAIKILTASDIVPFNVPSFSDTIAQLGYGFSRILVLIEAFSPSRTKYSLERVSKQRQYDKYGAEGEEAEPTTRLTETVKESCAKLKHNVSVKLGLLGVGDELAEAAEWDVGDVSVEFVIAGTVEESARYIRRFGDHAASTVGDAERQMLWGERPWFDSTVGLLFSRCVRHPIFYPDSLA
jgi:hypothetical protein